MNEVVFLGIPIVLGLLVALYAYSQFRRIEDKLVRAIAALAVGVLPFIILAPNQTYLEIMQKLLIGY